MKTNVLPNSDIRVSILGIGCVKFGRNSCVKYPKDFAIPTENHLKKLLERSSDCGINFLDTAPAYGSSEERIGRILGDKRKKWVICTKAGEEFCEGRSHWDFSKKGIEKSVMNSLKRLKTDYIDILLVHSDGIDENGKKDAFDTLYKMKKKGIIRLFGMSVKTVDGGIFTVDNSEIVMISYNRECRENVKVIEYAKKCNKGVLIKKAFASGHFSGINSNAKSQEAINDIMAIEGIHSTIVGTIDVDHLKENVANVNAIQELFS